MDLSDSYVTTTLYRDAGVEPEESRAMHQMAASMGARCVTAYDMDQCLLRLWDPWHYRDDGTCCCDELPEALRWLTEAERAFLDSPAKMRHELASARREVRRCGGGVEEW